jgi:hypothetical protein
MGDERKERSGRSRMGRREREERKTRMSGTGGITPLLNEARPQNTMGTRHGEMGIWDGKVEQHLLPVAI